MKKVIMIISLISLILLSGCQKVEPSFCVVTNYSCGELRKLNVLPITQEELSEVKIKIPTEGYCEMSGIIQGEEVNIVTQIVNDTISFTFGEMFPKGEAFAPDENETLIGKCYMS